jgi:hypothetical protein
MLSDFRRAFKKGKVAMRVGTKSLLFGAHAFILHPVFVFLAYWKLFGFPWDPRLGLACAIHDLGYFSMDFVERPRSEEHVERGGRIMDRLCGRRWGDFVRRHSRSWCDLHGHPYSRLCVADKLAFVITPAWLYLPMARASGELGEYMAAADGRECGGKFTEAERLLLQSGDPKLWLRGLKSYTQRWVEAHRNGQCAVCDADAGILKKPMVRAAARWMHCGNPASEKKSEPQPVLPVR